MSNELSASSGARTVIKESFHPCHVVMRSVEFLPFFFADELFAILGAVFPGILVLNANLHEKCRQVSVECDGTAPVTYQEGFRAHQRVTAVAVEGCLGTE